MTAVICGVVSECADGEGILVDVAGVVNQRHHEVAGPDVVQEVAEELAAERVVAEILDDASAVRVRPGLGQFLDGRRGKPREQQRLNRGIPQRVDVGFVRQHGVGRG